MRRLAWATLATLATLLVVAVVFRHQIERWLAASVALSIAYRILRHRYFPKPSMKKEPQ